MKPGVVSLKFIEEQPRILRLTTPELKKRSGPRSLRMTARFVLRISDSGHYRVIRSRPPM
jgi:hypothetical protein